MIFNWLKITKNDKMVNSFDSPFLRNFARNHHTKSGKNPKVGNTYDTPERPLTLQYSISYNIIQNLIIKQGFKCYSLFRNKFLKMHDDMTMMMTIQ